MLKHLISVAGLGLWQSNPIYSLLLWFDGVIYSLVSYSYKIFMIMTQINYNVIYEMMEPLIDRIKALIMVFIMFKVGCALLQYLVNPDKLNNDKVGGKALVTNILIAAGLLGIYNFVFAISNDLSMLLVGSFDGSAFQVLDPPEAGDEGGLIARFVFGANESMKNVDNFGKYLATSTLSIFLHSAPDSKSNEAESIYAEILAAEGDEDDDFDMMKISELSDDIGRTVQYRYPVLSGLVGLFLIYSIVKIAIEVGVRMFKLIILQIIAPIPICAIVSDGVGGGMFKKYTDLFLSTFAEVFVRIASMYLMTAFIGEFYSLIMGTGNNSSLFTGGTSDLPFITKGILLVIVVVAGYRFVNVLPEFLGKIFSGLGGNKEKNGFGKFMAGMAGAGIGAVGGLAAGIGGGAGVLGSLYNMGAGAVGGAKSGGKGEGIAGQIKNLQSSANNALETNKQGGIVKRGFNELGKATGVNAIRKGKKSDQISALKEQNETRAQQNKDMQDRAAEASEAVSRVESDYTYADGTRIKYGSDENAFANAVADNNADYRAEVRKAEEADERIKADKYTDDPPSQILGPNGRPIPGKSAATKRDEDIAARQSHRIAADTKHREVAKEARDRRQASVDAEAGPGYTKAEIKSKTKANNDATKATDSQIKEIQKGIDKL